MRDCDNETCAWDTHIWGSCLWENKVKMLISAEYYRQYKHTVPIQQVGLTICKRQVTMNEYIQKDLERISKGHSLRIYWCRHLNRCLFVTSCLKKWHSGTKVLSCDIIHLSLDCSSADRQKFSIQYRAVFQYQLLFVPGQPLQQMRCR